MDVRDELRHAGWVALASEQASRQGDSVPAVHREAGFVFYFYSEEGNEPPHVHVDKGDGTAKFWRDPVRLVWAEGLKVSELGKALRIAEREQGKLLAKWNEIHARET